MTSQKDSGLGRVFVKIKNPKHRDKGRGLFEASVRRSWIPASFPILQSQVTTEIGGLVENGPERAKFGEYQ